MRNKVRKFRMLSELTQTELAYRVQVTRQTIHAIETGKHNLSIVLALKIASVLGQDINRLFLLEEMDWH